ncbi:MAG: TIGR03621 family F420-dependent LLM class oxidoreductase [Microthrixaceae bacterium]
MAHSRKFRFGAQLHQPLAGLTWAQTAQRIEELGYSTLFLPDHFGEQLAPIAAMTAAAAATTTLRVGTLVFDNDYRHPVVLAKEMATIDVLFEGRCEVGMGAGWMATDYAESGISMDPPKVRVDRLIEGAEIVRGLWGEGPVNHSGEHYTITEMVGLPRPSSAGGPPLIIAGGSPRMLRFAGRTADIVGVNPSIHSGEVDAEAARDGMADRMDRKVQWVREGAGGRFDDLEINAWVPVVAITDDAQAVAEMIAPGFGIDVEHASEALDSPMTMVGTEDQIAERLRERRDRWGFSYHVVQNESALALAPVVAALTGN